MYDMIECPRCGKLTIRVFKESTKRTLVQASRINWFMFTDRYHLLVDKCPECGLPASEIKKYYRKYGWDIV
jgi:ribosomal protein L37E